MMVPFAKPFIAKEEISAAAKVIRSGWITQGPKVKEFEDVFASYAWARYACAVSNCTAALSLALKAVGVEPGDVVITVSHSFIATANSIRHCGAEPVFVDIDPDTFNMSGIALSKVLHEDCEFRSGKLYYKKVREIAVGESPLRYFLYKPGGRLAAILVVHQMGVPCDLNIILPLARKFKLPVVEDAACAAGSEFLPAGKKRWEKIGRPHGDIACFSFHPRKLITTGEGGMITTNNPEYDKKIRLLRHHGMSMSDLIRHKSEKIVFEEYLTTGNNYRMPDILAAIGLVQLNRLPKLISERRKIASIYQNSLKDIPWLRLPKEPAYARCNWQSFPVRLLKGAPLSRNKFMQYLLDAGISVRPGIMNAHQEKPYQSAGWDLPVSEECRKSSLLLPIFNGIKSEQIKKIIRKIKNA